MTGPEADLTGWACEPFSAAGFTHDVYRKGSGPGVVLIPEMPGVHPGVLALGKLSGGQTASPWLSRRSTAPRALRRCALEWCRCCCAGAWRRSSRRWRPTGNARWPTICVRWRVKPTPRLRARGWVSSGSASQVASRWLPRWTTASWPRCSAQPSVPLALTSRQKRDPGVSEREMKVIEKRAAEEGLCALGPSIQR